MRYLLTLLFLVLLAGEARAQFQGTVVQTCGTLPQAYAPGSTRLPAIDVNGNLCSSGASLPAGQLPGTATNDNALAGNVGEFISSFVAAGSAVPLTTGTGASVTSITLTAGDWDIWAVISFTGGTTTTVGYLLGSINTVANTTGASPARSDLFYNNATVFNVLGQTDFVIGAIRASLAAGATYFLNAQATFGVSTCSAFGGIYARRRR